MLIDDGQQIPLRQPTKLDFSHPLFTLMIYLDHDGQLQMVTSGGNADWSEHTFTPNVTNQSVELTVSNHGAPCQFYTGENENQPKIFYQLR